MGGGETTDSLVVWLPSDRILFTGNLFGPLFGHVPNLVTMGGDPYCDPVLYIESLNTVLSFAPERLITGHFDPIEGADRITEEDSSAPRAGMSRRGGQWSRKAFSPNRCRSAGQMAPRVSL
jgi:glyoxylase-like metal-dependent hydrolase (beta-lactamase superfamily II)